MRPGFAPASDTASHLNWRWAESLARVGRTLSLALNPRFAEAMKGRGTAALVEAAWRLTTSRPENAARALDPSAPDVLVEEGRLLLLRSRARRGAPSDADRTAAREALEAARKANARDAAPLVGLALLARAESDSEDALRLAEAALAVDPLEPEARALRAGLTAPR